MGPRLVILGTIFGAILLSLFLTTINAEASLSSSLPPAGDTMSAAPPIIAPASDESQGCAVSDRFPGSVLQWCELITKYANKRGISPDLIAALILQESGGDPGAISSSGAVGLMQVMPSDGRAASFLCAGGPCFTGRPSTQELLDPEANIAFGTKLLAGLFSRNGDLREALKSYGPMDMGYGYADKVLTLYRQFGK